MTIAWLPKTFQADLAVIRLSLNSYHSSVLCVGCGIFLKLLILNFKESILFCDNGLKLWLLDLYGIIDKKYVSLTSLIICCRCNSV